MSVLTIDPARVELTEAWLRAQSPPLRPIVAGDDWVVRFQVRTSDDEAVDLTDCTIWMTVRQQDGSAILVSRKSGTAISGSSPTRYQIVIDSNQTTENTTDDTGRGWFTLRFGRETADYTALIAALGINVFDIRIRFSDLSVETFLTGRIEFLRPRTDPLT